MINKTIALIGEDKNTTIINFNPEYDLTNQVSLISVNADNCSIENLQITITNKSHFISVDIQSGGCCGDPDVVHTTSLINGGISINSKYNTIKNIIITNVTDGIELSTDSASNTIIYNVIKNNQIGIDSFNSVNNTISNNIVSHNQEHNIYLSTGSDSNTVSFNIIDTSIYGIRIKGSQDNHVFKNCIQNNDIGIYCCCDSISNYIYGNTLLNSTLANAKETEGLTNIWYYYLNSTGNYWDDYNDSDDNNDGIGDTPYEIPRAGNQDSYPLMFPPLDIPYKQ